MVFALMYELSVAYDKFDYTEISGSIVYGKQQLPHTCLEFQYNHPHLVFRCALMKKLKYRVGPPMESLPLPSPFCLKERFTLYQMIEFIRAFSSKKDRPWGISNTGLHF